MRSFQWNVLIFTQVYVVHHVYCPTTIFEQFSFRLHQIEFTFYQSDSGLFNIFDFVLICFDWSWIVIVIDRMILQMTGWIMKCIRYVHTKRKMSDIHSISKIMNTLKICTDQKMLNNFFFLQIKSLSFFVLIAKFLYWSCEECLTSTYISPVDFWDKKTLFYHFSDSVVKMIFRVEFFINVMNFFQL